MAGAVYKRRGSFYMNSFQADNFLVFKKMKTVKEQCNIYTYRAK